MVKFEKRRQRDDESIDKFLDDLELLRRRSNHDDRISERNLAIASEFMDGVKSDELKTMVATHFSLSADLCRREYLLIKPRAQSRYNIYGKYSGMNTGTSCVWYKPRDDMDKRRSCAFCGSLDDHLSARSTYKQNMKAIGYFLDDVDAIDEDHEEDVRGLIKKYGPSRFFCILEGHFKPDCTQFWDAVADAKHPRHKEALSGVKVSRARLMNEPESRNKEVTQGTFTTKKVKTLPDDIDCESGEYLPVGHIWKFDPEEFEQRNFGVKCNFSKIRIEPVMLNFLAKTENLRKTRSEQPKIQSRESSGKKQREIAIRNFQI